MTSPANKYCISLLAIPLMLISNTALAVANESGLSSSTVDLAAFLKMFVGLIGIVALIFFVAWLSRKMKLVQHFSSGYQIKNLASLSLSNREKVCLIEVGGKQVLIGIAPGAINRLHVFDEEIAIDSVNQTDEGNAGFSTYFKKALGMPNSSDPKGKQL